MPEDYGYEHCQHVVDEDNDGETLCYRPADHQCGKCYLWFCTSHINQITGLCEVCHRGETGQ